MPNHRNDDYRTGHRIDQRRIPRACDRIELTMKDRTLLRFGIIGTVVVALCCFTPILVILAAAVGLSALTGYLDYVLIPALIFFIGLSMYAVRQRKNHCDTTECSDTP